MNKLTDLIVSFRDKNPYRVVGEDDSVTGQRVGRFQELFPTPKEAVSLIAGDALHNLRSALDLLYCQLVANNGKQISESDQFPITADAQKFEARLPEIKARIGVSAAPTLEDLKPYGGGHDAYWRLHKLDIIDKHRLLLATVAALREIIQTVPVESVENAPVEVSAIAVHLEPDNIRPVDDGDELFRLDSEPEGEIKYGFEIALHEPPIAECEPVVALLNYFAGGVRETIERFVTAGHLAAS
jgi:hypothetical protein